jgi:hypothetical protein
MAAAISDVAAARAINPESQPWKWTHLIFRRFIESLAHQCRARDWTVFVDTTSSFSVYTELAVSAVDRLITPVSTDDSTGVATNAMFRFLHGHAPRHPINVSSTFAAKASRLGVQVPRIHLVVGNRITRYGGAAGAFAALSDATANTLWTEFLNHPEHFTTRPTVPKTLAQFGQEYSVPLREFNTAGVVASHLGRRLSEMKGGDYDVHGVSVQLNQDRIIEGLNAMDDVLERL